ncbi:MAG: hypothetical protein HYU64_09005 [Armatimonadetes bacterium]|nr:hypothetical protein [Armatimonadota bacterium]
MRHKLLSGFAILAFFILATGPLLAAPNATIYLAVPTPSPVEAGQMLNIQVVVLNTGSVAWKAGEYEINAEIFDKDRNYLISSDFVLGNTPVAQGATAVLNVPFLVPVSYSGAYYIRINFRFQRETLAKSDAYFPFQVTSLGVPKPPTPEVEIHGNLSYSGSYSPRRVGNSTFNINMNGRAGDKHTFTATSITSPNAALSNNMFTYDYGGRFNATAGDTVGTQYSPLTFQGTFGRGFAGEAIAGKLRISAVKIQTRKPQEGSAFSNGVFDQYATGFRLHNTFTPFLTGSLTYGQLEDTEGSLGTPGPTLTPLRNQGWSTDLNYRKAGLSLSASAGRLGYTPDSRTVSEVIDKAWQFAGEYSSFLSDGRGGSLQANYQRAGSQYFALAAPGIVRDRETADSTWSHTWDSRVQTVLTYRNYHNNLARDGTVPTVSNTYAASTVNLTLSPMTRATFLLSKFKIGSTGPAPFSDNESSVFSVNLSQQMGKTFSLLANWQDTRYQDRVNLASDLTTQSVNLGLSGTLRGGQSVSAGFSKTRIAELATGFVTITTSANGNINLWIIPSKLSANLGISRYSTHGTNGAVGNQSMTYTLGAKWAMNTRHSLYLGLNATDYKDFVFPQASYSEPLLSLGSTWNF